MKSEITIRLDRRLKIGIPIAVGLILFFYLTRPIWHGLFFALIWRNISFWVVLAVVGVVISWGVEKGRWGLILLAVLLWFAFLFWMFNTYGTAVAFSFEPERVTEMANTEEVRYLPYEVAETFARARQEDPTKRVGDIDPLILGGEFFWVAPRIPNGIWNWLTRQVDGVFLVDETGGLRYERQTFKYGEGMGIFDSIAWQLKAKRYLAEYPEIFYFPWEGGWLGLAPYITYRFVFPVFVPRWGGVMLIHPDGRIEDLSPLEAQQDPRLEGRRLFPEKLARIYSGAWGYRQGGLLNILFTHHEQVEIADLANTRNEMPYFLPTAWGPQWMIAVNPYGPSQSIFKIFWFDVRTGYARLTEFAEERALVGPNKGESFARNETPGYTWREEEEGTYLAIEARPVIRGEFYWMYSVTTWEYTGVSLTILLDGYNSENVLHFCTRESLERWLLSKGQPDRVPCAAGAEVPTVPLAPAAVPTDLGALTEEELLRLLRQIADELERRR